MIGGAETRRRIGRLFGRVCGKCAGDDYGQGSCWNKEVVETKEGRSAETWPSPPHPQV